MYFFFLERREVKERERERNIDPLPLICTPTGDQNPKPGMCPNQESKW